MLISTSVKLFRFRVLSPHEGLHLVICGPDNEKAFGEASDSLSIGIPNYFTHPTPSPISQARTICVQLKPALRRVIPLDRNGGPESIGRVVFSNAPEFNILSVGIGVEWLVFPIVKNIVVPSFSNGPEAERD